MTIMTNNLVSKAREFATAKHEGQLRKYTGERYFSHCAEVLDILLKYCPDIDTEYQAAALLHDTVEDTHTTFQEIYDTFGDKVFEAVFFLTDCSKKEDGNRKIRKHIDRIHLLSCRSLPIYQVKCADLISNTKSIAKHDPDFARVYFNEKQLLLEGMMKNIPIIQEQNIFQAAIIMTNKGKV